MPKLCYVSKSPCGRDESEVALRKLTWQRLTWHVRPMSSPEIAANTKPVLLVVVNPNMREAEKGGAQVQAQPRLHSKTTSKTRSQSSQLCSSPEMKIFPFWPPGENAVQLSPAPQHPRAKEHMHF